jgi:hypothetical protein
MRLNDDNVQALAQEAEAVRIRAIVREEIAQALGALDLAAHDLDDYETPELDARAYQAGRQVAQQALRELKECWTEGHTFKSIWDEPRDTCRRCGAPVPEPENPFEDRTKNDGTR